MNPKKLIRKVLPKGAITLAEESYRKGRVYAMQGRAGFPARGLRVIAITGTNGKTTTACYVNAVLKAAGYRTALFSTAQIEMDGVEQLNRTHRTVPLTAQLVGFMQKAKATNVDFVVMETTSQALHQHKMIGIPVEIAVMTNLTQDHLDYHKTMENYAAAKARLFNEYMKPKQVLLNRDDDWFEYFSGVAVAPVTTYGESTASDIRIEDVRLQSSSSTWRMVSGGENVELKTLLPGRFNVQNATAAAGVGLLLGIAPKDIAAGILQLGAVAGRMEVIDAGQPFAVIVDYAHTPDALQNVLQAARGIAKGRVLAVYGATGDRDATKRPVMGKIGGQLADKVFLTDDETYSEDGAMIRSAVREGLDKAKGTYVEIADRREAIAAAFAEARAGDVVLLAGIGHQDTRNMGGKSIAWDEREVARELLHSR